jgi:hypothetical protein
VATQLLYKDVSLKLDARRPCRDLATYQNILNYIQRFSMNIEPFVADDSRGQEWLQRLMPPLKLRPLGSLRFSTFPPKDIRHPSVPSVLNGPSWDALRNIFIRPKNNGEIGHTEKDNNSTGITQMRDTLRDLKLPGHTKGTLTPWLAFNEGTRLSRRAAWVSSLRPLEMLDSSMELDFKSTILQPGKSFRMELYGAKVSTDGPRNGAAVDVIERVLHYVGVGDTIDTLSMTGTPADRQDEPDMYTNLFQRLNISAFLNVPKMTFRDVNFEYLPLSLGQSINFSSVKQLHIFQCVPLHNLLLLFMDSTSGTNLETLSIGNCDWEADYDILDEFIESFSSLRKFSAKICDGWMPEHEAFAPHKDLEVYDVDLGHPDNDIFWLDEMAIVS